MTSKFSIPTFLKLKERGTTYSTMGERLNQPDQKVMHIISAHTIQSHSYNNHRKCWEIQSSVGPGKKRKLVREITSWFLSQSTMGKKGNKVRNRG